MGFFTAILVWLVMAAVIGAGIVVAVKFGSLWLLLGSILVFTIAFAKIGCLTH
jgi:hypothetical protein